MPRFGNRSAASGQPVDEIPRPQIAAERLTEASAIDSLARLAILLSTYVLGAAAAAWWAHPVGWLLFSVYGGLVLASLFAAEHEAIHGSLFSSDAANHVAGALTGAACANPYSTYRSFHLRHHTRTHAPGDTEPFVVVRNRFQQVTMMPFATLGLSCLLWSEYVKGLARRRADWARRTQRTDLDLLSLLAVGLFAGALIFVGATFGWTSVLVVWVLPLLASFVWEAVFSTPEHYECDYGPGSVFSTTRSVTTTAPTRWFVWNANYHVAHHLVPSIPGRQLPRLQELIADKCTVTERSYWSYHRGLWRRIGRGELPEPPPWTTEVDLTTPDDSKERTP